ncbi:membrane dipeptidase [Ureibacillus xyleni]|uniref:Membrane dipeptidase n=1 Tax=Ureibacillus xyleni TaxID=614648 RepID=A0A285S7N3_9BACL|nr:membrane dipeptidase [Ureibacillus xyleni]SOC03522.1 membrane dipeptidase [Ureibacillus xyleni]
MEIIDLHCDVLEKLSRMEDVQFRKDSRLHASLENLQKGNVKVQVFAIFIEPHIPQEQKFYEAIRQVEAFQNKVLSEPEMVHITDWKQLNELQEGEIGAILSLEGCDCIGDDLHKLKLLLDAGVKLVGLTWNYENAVAYGASESPDKGLKPFAQQVIQLLNERNVIIDVAHLNEQGFFDLLPLANNLIASHCNARALYDHPRNLSDEQIRQLVKHGGRIHVVFYPPFINHNNEVTTIKHLVKHIMHIASLVGIDHIGFGSDFDGIDLTVEKLTNASEYPNLIQALTETFTTEEIETMASKGFMQYISKVGMR